MAWLDALVKEGFIPSSKNLEEDHDGERISDSRDFDLLEMVDPSSILCKKLRNLLRESSALEAHYFSQFVTALHAVSADHDSKDKASSIIENCIHELDSEFVRQNYPAFLDAPSAKTAALNEIRRQVYMALLSNDPEALLKTLSTLSVPEATLEYSHDWIATIGAYLELYKLASCYIGFLPSSPSTDRMQSCISSLCVHTLLPTIKSKIELLKAEEEVKSGAILPIDSR